MAIAAEVGPSQHPPILWVSTHSAHMLGKGVQTHTVSSSAPGPESRPAEARGEL